MLENGDIDYPSFERLVDRQLENGTNGIVVLGTTGESATITAKERKKIIRQLVIQVGDRIPIIVGTGCNSTRKSIELTKEAMELGATAALLVTPYYNKPTEEGLYQHYREIAEAVPIPQILYNVPSRTASDLLPKTIERLGKLPNIVALKDATGILDRFRALQQTDCQIDCLSGDDPTSMEFILQGGTGVITVTGNVVPKLMHDMVDAALAGDRNQAENYNQKLSVFFEQLFLESNPIPTKWMLFKMGLIQSHIRLPLLPLRESLHHQIEATIDRFNLKIN